MKISPPKKLRMVFRSNWYAPRHSIGLFKLLFATNHIAFQTPFICASVFPAWRRRFMMACWRQHGALQPTIGTRPSTWPLRRRTYAERPRARNTPAPYADEIHVEEFTPIAYRTNRCLLSIIRGTPNSLSSPFWWRHPITTTISPYTHVYIHVYSARAYSAPPTMCVDDRCRGRQYLNTTCVEEHSTVPRIYMRAVFVCEC